MNRYNVMYIPHINVWTGKGILLARVNTKREAVKVAKQLKLQERKVWIEVYRVTKTGIIKV